MSVERMLYDLAISAGKPRSWAGQLQREVAELKRQATQWENVQAGIRTPWIEATGGRFDVLPHEGASLLGNEAQEIPSGVWTEPTYDGTSGATWSKGMEIDVDNGRIYFQGVPRDAVVAILCWADWETNVTGQRGIRWLADDGSSRSVILAAADCDDTITTYGPHLFHMRSLPSAHTYYYMQVWQTSGGGLDLGYRCMCVMRLR